MINPLLILQVRAEARALLFRCGEYEDLAQAIEPLLSYAHANGIEEEIEADAIWAIIKTAFGGDWVDE
jgi:hypothetical protein